jgi:hypothetical protein
MKTITRALSIADFLLVVASIDAHVFWPYEILCKFYPEQEMS